MMVVDVFIPFAQDRPWVFAKIVSYLRTKNRQKIVSPFRFPAIPPLPTLFRPSKHDKLTC